MLGRILFITSPYGGLPIGMRNSLKRMQTTFTESPLWRMKEAYDEFKPDTMIFFHHFLKEWNKDIYKEISNIMCHKMYWDWECPWEIDYLNEYHHLFTFILVQDKNSAKVINQRTGSEKAIFVPHAADPQSNPHMENVPFQYRSDLCFIGAAYPSRVKFMRETFPYLKDYKVVVGGTGWEFLPDTRGQLIKQDAITGKEYLLYTNGANVVINLHRESEELTMANKEHVKASSPNNRFFEVNMMGKFQMVDTLRYPEVEEYYPDTISFRGSAEFLEKFYKYMHVYTTRNELAQKNREHSLKFHTYENRWSEIIANLI